MTVTEPASARSEDEAGWPTGMPDPASPGGWPHDGPQPPTHLWVMRLETLGAEWATYECWSPADSTLQATLTIRREHYELLDADALGVLAQMLCGPKPLRRPRT
jgi:hypothetical protein